MTKKIIQKKLIECNEYLERIAKLLKKYGMPTETDYKKEIIANAAMNDKKRRSNSLNIVLIKDIGKGYIYKTECDKFEDFLKGAE